MATESNPTTPSVPSTTFVASLMADGSDGGRLNPCRSPEPATQGAVQIPQAYTARVRYEPMERRHVSSGTEWESRVGYSRAVRVGDRVLISGTTATDDDGNVVAPGDPVAQTRRALANVVDALEAAGADVDDVVRTRLFVTDVDRWEAIGEVHGELFGDVRPASTMVEVARLVDPDLVVEVEAEAVVGSGDPNGERR